MQMNNMINGKKISVLGAGVSGAALAALAAKQGAKVFVSDAKEISKETEEFFKANGIMWEASGNTELLLDADVIVVSSGISPKNEMLVEAGKRGITVIGELDFVSPYLSGTIIAVTGSNGKTTTTSMIGHLLAEAGCNVITCGNIGIPVAKAADSNYDFIVMELSSFQLYWAKTFRCDAAVVCNLAPDHIDWHGSYENYVASKANIIKCLSCGGAAIYQKRDEAVLGAASDVISLPMSWGPCLKDKNGIYMDSEASSAWLNNGGCSSCKKLFDFSSVKLLGSHNLENSAMAMTVLALFEIEAAAGSIENYVPPKHRCAYAGEVKGVTFVDDSKGTNVAATLTAMSSLPGGKVIILGGQGKGEDYAPLAEGAIKYTKCAVLLGSEKDKIASALSAAGYNAFTKVNDMDEAVEAAYIKASAGETVLLSPACTSWDMYPNYGARGDHFVRAAKKRIERES